MSYVTLRLLATFKALTVQFHTRDCSVTRRTVNYHEPSSGCLFPILVSPLTAILFSSQPPLEEHEIDSTATAAVL